MKKIEIWAGAECTVSRIGDRYSDQLELTGHAARIDDIDRMAALRVGAVRFPVLWERTAPLGVERADWSWADERLERLRRLGIRPIIGLVHHGSGPAHTSLVDDGFPEELARFARAVAARYPWVTDYTPINEPLTTARFSGLYGHWYPHGRDTNTFQRALLVQCKATVQAMRMIREVTPGARLVQTEDMGTVFSTPALDYQATFENHRRWLSLDLLCGRVDRRHFLWRSLLEWGASEAELDALASRPCPPDILGINYYLTSDRFLDERLDRYPVAFHGGNGRHAYADVEAVRARREGIVGHRVRLDEAWQRYRLPVATTEVHVGCSREEQVRWLHEAWRGAHDALAGGADVRAVTVWSLFGSMDWDSLLVLDSGHYEPGVFDVRAHEPRPTALAQVARDLATTGDSTHPVVTGPGWWHRSERLIYASAGERAPRGAGRSHHGHPILVTGAHGTLARTFGRTCDRRGLPVHLLSRAQMDITDPASIDEVIQRIKPWAIINAAGYVRVDEAEHNAIRCHRENAHGPAVLAAACANHRLPLLTFSSDLVFDGNKAAPYMEADAVSPLNVYGRTKAEAERRVLALLPTALVVRTSAFFGPWDEHNFVTRALHDLEAGRRLRVAADVVVSPTYVPDLVSAALDLLTDGECGIWHLSNPGAITWADLARRAAQIAGVPAWTLEPVAAHDLNLAAPRPAYSVLGSERGWLMPSLDDALERYVQERQEGASQADAA